MVFHYGTKTSSEKTVDLIGAGIEKVLGAMQAVKEQTTEFCYENHIVLEQLSKFATKAFLHSTIDFAASGAITRVMHVVFNRGNEPDMKQLHL